MMNNMSQLKNHLQPLPISVGITSMAVIAFQLVIVQLLSISQWHHFAYMVISMAMLGFGAAGTVLALFRQWFRENSERVLPVIYLLCGVSMALSGRMIGVFGDFDTFLLFFDRMQIVLMVFTYLIYCLPFFFGGLAITLIFYTEITGIGRYYFFNLAGSGLGAVLVVALLWIVPATLLPALLSFLPLTAAWLVMSQTSPVRSYVLAGVLLTIATLFFPARPGVSEYKDIYAALQLPGAEIIHEQSSPYGLMQVVHAPAQRFAPSLSLQYRGDPPVRNVVFNNGDYFGTLLGHGAGTPAGNHILDYTTRGLPYFLRPVEEVLVLNARTGNDVSHALHHGARRIAAVESNRPVNNLLTTRHPEWIDSIYHRDEVSLHRSAVRSWLTATARTDDTYDLIVLPVIGTFGGSSGIDAISEHYELTYQAFEIMWDRLEENGMISVTAWADYPVRAPLKLLATWRKLLDEKLAQDERYAHSLNGSAGEIPPEMEIDAEEAEEDTVSVSEPEVIEMDPEIIRDHIVAIRSWGTITFLVSPTPFTEDERRKLRSYASGLSFDPLLLADLERGERDYYGFVEDRRFFNYIDTVMAGSRIDFFDYYPFDVRPTPDNRPFFTNYMSFWKLRELSHLFGREKLPYIELGYVVVVVALFQIVITALVLIILPLFRVGHKNTLRRWTFFYFAGIGLGFMFFEIVLIQKMILYLGEPVYAMAIVLTVLLISSGMGSFYSSRLEPTSKVKVVVGCIIVLMIVLYNAFLMSLLTLTIGLPAIIKVVFVFAILGLPAFFMGMMFPLGLRRLLKSNETQIPWACGVDSCLSVSATVLAMLFALEYGYVVVMGLAALSYGMSAFSVMGFDTE